MTAARSVRSTAYGARLFAYVLVVAAVGSGLLGLGYSLAWPTIADVALGEASAEEPLTLAAGAVLGLLGVYVLGAGLLTALHKLVADSVATGIESAETPVGGLTTPAGNDERADSTDQAAEPKAPSDQPESESRPSPTTGSDSGPTPEAEPDGTPAGQPPSATATPAAGTDGTTADSQPQAEPAATDVASDAAEAAPEVNGPGAPGDSGAAGTGATDGDHQAAELDTRVGQSGGSDPESPKDVAGAADAPAESVTAMPDPNADSGVPDTGSQAGSDTGPNSLSDGSSSPSPGSDPSPGLKPDADKRLEVTDEWAPPEGLETEPVEVRMSDAAPADVEEGGPGPADAGSTDQPGDPSPERPEPSPEEIAFGSSGSEAGQGSGRNAGPDAGPDDGGVTERADWFDDGSGEQSDAEATGKRSNAEATEEQSDTEPTEEQSDAEPTEDQSAGTDSFEPAGSTAPSDPLADPNEKE